MSFPGFRFSALALYRLYCITHNSRFISLRKVHIIRYLGMRNKDVSHCSNSHVFGENESESVLVQERKIFSANNFL